MKTLTYILTLLPGAKMAHTLFNEKSISGQYLFKAAIAYLAAIDFSWVKIGHYLFVALKQAFRDNILSDVEMDFIILTITGYWLLAKNSIKQFSHSK